MGIYLDLADVVAGHPEAERELEKMRKIIDAARCIRHWHDREPDGMVVSAEHVRLLWAALADLDA